MSPDSTVAGRVASAMRATFSQPGHKQVSALFPAVSLDLLQRSVLHWTTQCLLANGSMHL